jgi:hypothetical protein
VLLTRESTGLRVLTTPGSPFTTRREAAAALDSTLQPLRPSGPADLAISGANGTWVDSLISASLEKYFPTPAPPLTPKLQLGEALGASALLQVVLAAHCLSTPPDSSEARGRAHRADRADRAALAALGWNQHAASAVVERL